MVVTRQSLSATVFPDTGVHRSDCDLQLPLHDINLGISEVSAPSIVLCNPIDSNVVLLEKGEELLVCHSSVWGTEISTYCSGVSSNRACVIAASTADVIGNTGLSSVLPTGKTTPDSRLNVHCKSFVSTKCSNVVVDVASTQVGDEITTRDVGASSSLPSDKLSVGYKQKAQLESTSTIRVYDVRSQLDIDMFLISNIPPVMVVPVDLPEIRNDWLQFPSEELNHYLNIHQQVVSSRVPNFYGCKIHVPSGFNVSVWRDRLQLAGFHDMELCEFLDYGFPIGYCSDRLPMPATRNHSRSYMYPHHVDAYINKEIQERATLGPFSSNPLCSFLMVSPLNTVSKKGSEDARRVIMDLSWPWGYSVNDGIAKDIYLGCEVSVHYPSLDDLLARVVELGSGCLLFKTDLSRAYRQLHCCPGDVGLLGYSWRGSLFIDTVLPFGLRSSAMFCQRVTDAISFLFRQEGYFVINFLDDFGGVDVTCRADEAFRTLRHLLRELGVGEATSKAVFPCTSMIFLGILIDTEEMTISVPFDKFQDILQVLDLWSDKSSASKKEVQSLIGKLQFAAKCVRPGRVFISRMLEHLRSLTDLHPNAQVSLPVSFVKDVLWWREFIPSYNGVSIIPQEGWSEPDEIIATDSCLTGCGGYSSLIQEYFHTSFPSKILKQALDINCLELLAVVVALKLWGNLLKGKRIKVLCDNQTTVYVLNSGRVRNAFLSACLREVAFQCALQETQLFAVHVEGTSNRLCDLLSRCHTNSAMLDEFLRTGGREMQERVVPEHLFEFSSAW